jgi:UDP:flavonoid glycosyltransferase YjiC (YdhE family)
MKQVTSELKFMKAFKPDLVFSDTRLSSVIAGKLMGLPVVLMLNQFMPMVPRTDEKVTLSQFADGSILTLLGQGWGSSDVILIPDFPEPHTLSLDSLRIPRVYRNMVRMIGAILPRKSSDVEGTSKVRKEAGVMEGERLIYAAISGPTQERDPLIRLLAPILEEFPEGYKALMSLGDPNGGSKPSSSGALTIIPWVKNRFEYLKTCELVICRGGHNTIMQSIFYGKPSIIIPTPNHTEQYTNARRAAEMGVAKAIHQKDVDTTRLLEIVKEIMNGSEYQNRLVEMQSRDYFNGIEKAIEALSELLSN